MAAPRRPTAPTVGSILTADDRDVVLLQLGGPHESYAEPGSSEETLVFYTTRWDAVELYLERQCFTNGMITQRKVYVIPPGLRGGDVRQTWIAYFETACDRPWVNCRITVKQVR